MYYRTHQHIQDISMIYCPGLQTWHFFPESPYPRRRGTLRSASCELRNAVVGESSLWLLSIMETIGYHQLL